MNMDSLRAQMHCRLFSMVCMTLHSEVPARAVFLPRLVFCKTFTRTVCMINCCRCRRQVQSQLVSKYFLLFGNDATVNTTDIVQIRRVILTIFLISRGRSRVRGSIPAPMAVLGMSGKASGAKILVIARLVTFKHRDITTR